MAEALIKSSFRLRVFVDLAMRSVFHELRGVESVKNKSDLASLSWDVLKR